MLWHGLKQNSTKNLIRITKQKTNKSTSRYGWKVKKSYQINKQTFRIYKPSQWHAIVFKNKYLSTKTIFFYSPLYYFKLNVPSRFTQLTFDANTNSFNLHSLYINNNYRLFMTSLNTLFASFYKPFFKKIKFKGKGYYIYKNKRNTITPQFGYSHRLYLYSYFSSVKFLSKTSIFIFGLLKNDVLQIAQSVKSMRPINIFTGRGVRFSREVIYKKVGKVSSYR